MRCRLITTPLGRMLLAAEGRELRHIVMGETEAIAAARQWPSDGGELDEAARQIAQYFAGERRAFDLALAPQGTEFQRQVWAELQNIPYGETISYGELARRIGRPGASRAVGGANNRNPLPIVIPCHRVIGADGSLVGFGGGLHTKERLLRLERDFSGPLQETESATCKAQAC